MSNIKTLTTSNNKKIYIFDDIYDAAARMRFYLFIKNSYFKTDGRPDAGTLETCGDLHLFSPFSIDDIENMGLLIHPDSKIFEELLGGQRVANSRVNLATLNDKNRFHTDTTSAGLTLLYYPNFRWELEWGGYTLFSDDSMAEIEHCVAYKPGRVIIFDGTIPHCIGAPTIIAPSYRFSFAIQYIKNS